MSAVIAWSDTLRLGYEPMDETHEEFVELIGQMQLAPDADLAVLLSLLLAHCEAHFALENDWMRETRFPPRDCHIEQHEAVLTSIREVQALLAQGDVPVCRRLVEALADWFPNHAAHLDSALAHWMFKRQYGGKPVVLHRTVAA